MKLRAFLSTVPMAAVALALPTQAVPRYVAAMDHAEKPRSSFRSWRMVNGWAERSVAIQTVERNGENGDYMSATHVIFDSPSSPMEIARLQHLCERWTCRLGENPLYPRA